MIKVLPIEKKEVKCEPRFVLETTIGYGEHCCDTFTTHSLTIVDSLKGHFDSWNYIKRKDAEKIYKFFNEILNRDACRHIVLNDVWRLAHDSRVKHWFEDFMSEEEMKTMYRYHENFETLFTSDVEYNWYGLVRINIYYYDEEGNKHDCEVVDDPPRTGGHMVLDA